MEIPFKIDKSWTLFLDRDGVINLHYPNDYVKSWQEFIFLEGVLDAIRDLSHLFKRVIVITNQQGVGKKLMSATDLEFIHKKMRQEIKKNGGAIHAIYTATKLKSEKNNMRKPNPDMALQARRDFEGLDFSKSVMVGDSLSDMQFGKNLGMKTVFISNEKHTHELADWVSSSLSEFADLIKK